MSKVEVLGWFGNGNLGDEIILECMLSDIKRADPNVSFVVISDDPRESERRQGVRSISRGGSRDRPRRSDRPRCRPGRVRVPRSELH